MITASPTAPAGCLQHLTTYSADTFRVPQAAVLCRNNAPLVTHAFACIRRGVPVCILGRDLGASLTKIIKSFKLTPADWHASGCDKLDAWFAREVKKIKRPSQRGALEDRFGCLKAVMTSSSSEADATAKIDSLFTSEPKPGVLVLSTGHKAKGLEWHTVFILDQHLVPSRYAATQADLWQERNLLYVMVTRSMDTLNYIKSGTWK